MYSTDITGVRAKFIVIAFANISAKNTNFMNEKIIYRNKAQLRTFWRSIRKMINISRYIRDNLDAVRESRIFAKTLKDLLAALAKAIRSSAIT